MHQRTFVVDTYGVEGKDKYVLERIFKITEGRTRTYVLKNSDNATNTDITIVNVSKKEAIREWGSMHLDSNGNPSCPTLLVGANKPKNNRFSKKFERPNHFSFITYKPKYEKIVK